MYPCPFHQCCGALSSNSGCRIVGNYQFGERREGTLAVAIHEEMVSTSWMEVVVFELYLRIAVNSSMPLMLTSFVRSRFQVSFWEPRGQEGKSILVKGVAAGGGHTLVGLNGEGEDAVEAAYEGCGVFEGDAFHEEGLVEQEPGCVCCEGGVVGVGFQFFDDFVVGVDFEDGEGHWHFRLAHGAEHLLHLLRRLFFIGDDAGGGIGEADGGADVFHLIAQSGFKAGEERLKCFVGFGFGVGFEVFSGGGFGDGFEVEVAVLFNAGEDDFVDVVIEDEDFDVFLFVDFEQGGGAEQRLRAAGDVVEALLVRDHAIFDFGERGEGFRFGGFEADEVEEGFAVGVVAVDSFFQRAIVLGDEFEVFFGLVGGDQFEFGKDLFDAGGADAGEDAVLLEEFAGDVEGEVFGVDDAADEAQVGGEKLFGVVEDEDAFDVEFDADFVLGLVEIEGGFGGDEEEGRVLERALSLGVKPEEGVGGVAGKGVVEADVVFVFEL